MKFNIFSYGKLVVTLNQGKLFLRSHFCGIPTRENHIYSNSPFMRITERDTDTYHHAWLLLEQILKIVLSR